MQKTFHRLFRIIDFKREYQQKSSGLNYLQLHTLEKIYKEKAMKTLEISKTLSMSPSTLIGVLDELEKKNLISRDRQEKDKRVVMVSVTNLGEAIVKNHFDEDEKFLSNLVIKLNEEEKKHLLNLLNKITDNTTELDELFK